MFFGLPLDVNLKSQKFLKVAGISNFYRSKLLKKVLIKMFTFTVGIMDRFRLR